MRKRLDLVLNGKGGVGKSFFAVNFVQFLKDKHIKHAVIDTDNENSTLKRFHPEAIYIELSQPAALDRIIVELDANPLVVVDCRAASTDMFLQYFTKIDIFEVLKELDASLTLVLPINHDPDSVKQVQLLIEQFGDKASYVVVKNRFFSEQFVIFDKSKTRCKLAEDLNGKEIEMLSLEDWLVVGLNQATMTVSLAVQSDKFYIPDRQRLIWWQREFYGQVKTARAFLLPQGKLSASRNGGSGE